MSTELSTVSSTNLWSRQCYQTNTYLFRPPMSPIIWCRFHNLHYQQQAPQRHLPRCQERSLRTLVWTVLLRIPVWRSRNGDRRPMTLYSLRQSEKGHFPQCIDVKRFRREKFLPVRFWHYASILMSVYSMVVVTLAKVCEKRLISKERKAPYIMREKQVMKMLTKNRHPFFVQIMYAFQDTERLCNFSSCLNDNYNLMFGFLRLCHDVGRAWWTFGLPAQTGLIRRGGGSVLYCRNIDCPGTFAPAWSHSSVCL